MLWLHSEVPYCSVLSCTVILYSHSTGFSQESQSNADTFVEKIELDHGRTSNTAASLALPTMRCYGPQDSSLQHSSHLLSPTEASGTF